MANPTLTPAPLRQRTPEQPKESPQPTTPQIPSSPPSPEPTEPVVDPVSPYEETDEPITREPEPHPNLPEIMQPDYETTGDGSSSSSGLGGKLLVGGLIVGGIWWLVRRKKKQRQASQYMGLGFVDKVWREETGRYEWGLFSKGRTHRPLKWWGTKRPTQAMIDKEERRVQFFKRNV